MKDSDRDALTALENAVITAAKEHCSNTTGAAQLWSALQALDRFKGDLALVAAEKLRILDGYFDQEQLPFCHSVSLFWPHTGKEGHRDYYDVANREGLFEFILYDVRQFQGEDPVVLWYDPS